MKRVFAISLVFFAAIATTAAAQDVPATNAGASSAASTTAAAATGSSSSSSIQAAIDANNQQISTLNAEIASDTAALAQAGADKKTLQAAISALDLQRNKVQTQVTLTQAQINTTQLQIQQLGGEIVDASQTIGTDQQTLGDYLVNLQKADDQSLLMQVLASNDITDVWSDVNATLQMQDAIQKNMEMLLTQKSSLTQTQVASQQKQETLTSQKASLATQQQTLAQTVQSQNELLTETDAKESTYEKLLAAAEAQLQSFTAFTQNAGGSKLLGNQTVCDSWGCYYNQRDTAWGSDSLDGTRYNLASDGCLITSMAMVLTHYGYRDVTPVTINSNPNNFAAYYPASLLFTINVDGVSATRKTAAIDATLSTGNPVIVGLNAYGGTHYVVLVSGSAGNYIMRDPYIADGDDVSFTASYSIRDIFGISKVIITG